MRVLGAIALVTALAQAKDVVRNWDVTYLTSNRGLDIPAKRGITVNGKFPIPPVEAAIGDTLILNVRNSLDVPTSLHAHGILQQGTNYYDGVSMTTECGIAPGANFTYRIPLKQAGTYWIHGHHHEQLFEGLRIPLVVRNIVEPYRYDAEYSLAGEDWWPVTLSEFMDSVQHKLAIPFSPPPRLLVNGYPANQTKQLDFEPGKTYRIRLTSMLSLAHYEFAIDDHDLQIIEVDGVYTKPKTVKVVRLASGQRVSVLVKAKRNPAYNYRYHLTMMGEFLPVIPGVLPATYDGIVKYCDNGQLFPTTSIPSEPLDDLSIEALSFEKQYTAQRSIYVKATNGFDPKFTPWESFNYKSYRAPLVPTMLSALTGKDMARNPVFYGPQTNAHVVNYNEVVELVIYTQAMFPHPLHLHGHVFQIVERGYLNDTTGERRRTLPYQGYSPVQRDTVYLPQGEYVVIRFKADNPGAWLFHCHFEMHMSIGMNMAFVVAPDRMQQTLKVPPSIIDQCKLQKKLYSGNAAGHMSYNTEGAPNLPDLTPIPGL
ncbi:ferroxidase fet3 [Dipsacomyces acuminosporus]|nr:ferroxidase fet3 [Dipsacomyces acuminosporus]